MTPIKADIFFHDEAPRIGCGNRRVTVLIGRRWLRITEIATGRRAKLPRKINHPFRAHAKVDTLAFLKFKPVEA